MRNNSAAGPALVPVLHVRHVSSVQANVSGRPPPGRPRRRRSPESRQEALGDPLQADAVQSGQEGFYHPPSSAALRSASQTFRGGRESLSNKTKPTEILRDLLSGENGQ